MSGFSASNRPRVSAAQGVAGAPATVAAFLRRELNETGSNYCVCQFAFGDLTSAEVLRTIDLFAREHMAVLLVDHNVRRVVRMAVEDIGLADPQALQQALALRADGTVAAWGDDFYGQTEVPAGKPPGP